MNLRSLDKRLLIAAALVIAAATFALIWMLASDTDQRDAPHQPEAGVLPLEAWSDGEPRPVQIRLDPARGPVVELDASREVVITPTVDALSLQWKARRSGAHTYFVGTGHLAESPAQVVWLFVDGNPQAHLQISIAELPARRLADDFILTAQLPPGSLHIAAPAGYAPQAVAAPASWDDGQHTLTYANFTGEHLATGGRDGEASLLSFIVWSKDHNRGWADCETAAGERTVEVSAQASLTLGSTPPVARWDYQKGNQALVIPVFDDPRNHPDEELAQGAVSEPNRWLRRAQTLAYGHSDPSDPRYGNGGLLGHGLGGTIVVPAEFVEDEAIERFAASLEDTNVEIAAQSGPEAGLSERTMVMEGAGCQALIDASAAASPAVITRFRPASRLTPQPAIGPGPAGLAAAVPVERLDGRLSSLLEKGLATRRLDNLREQQSALVFSTPFIATRNPLIGAATEALLEPERNHQWTVATRFAGALADLELWREASPLWVSSLGEAVSHAATTRRVAWWWDERGALVVYNPDEQTIDGFTLVVGGQVEVKSSQAEISSRTAKMGDGQPATLLWWNLDPGLHRIELFGDDTDKKRPAPVRWTLTEP